MSAINGDKARFNRIRKAKLAQRERNKALRLKLAAAVRDRFPPVQIIVTSGHRSVELSEMPAGSVFFSKPYQHAAVMASMRQMLAAPPG